MFKFSCNHKAVREKSVMWKWKWRSRRNWMYWIEGRDRAAHQAEQGARYIPEISQYRRAGSRKPLMSKMVQQERLRLWDARADDCDGARPTVIMVCSLE